MPEMSRVLLLGITLLSSAACDKKGDAPIAPAEPPPSKSAAPSTKASNEDGGSSTDKIEKVEIPEVRVKSDTSTSVRVRWITPAGTAVNDDAPFRVRWNRSDGLVEAPTDVRSTGSAVKDGFRIKVQPMKGAPNATLDGEIHIVVCDAENHSVCLPVRRSVELGFVVAKDATGEATVSIPLPQARAN